MNSWGSVQYNGFCNSTSVHSVQTQSVPGQLHPQPGMPCDAYRVHGCVGDHDLRVAWNGDTPGECRVSRRVPGVMPPIEGVSRHWAGEGRGERACRTHLAQTGTVGYSLSVSLITLHRKGRSLVRSHVTDCPPRTCRNNKRVRHCTLLFAHRGTHIAPHQVPRGA